MTPAPTSARPRSFCPACRRRVRQFSRGGSLGRPNAKCPQCGSLERHRFLAVLLDEVVGTLPRDATIVEVAPTASVSSLLGELEVARYLRVDLDPAADGRRVDVQASLTDLPLPSDSVDLIVCYHVLEHIPDDVAAMRELARVLKPTGLALVQVPYRHDELTDEDPDADAEERIRRFHQADHVRWYGTDFEARLEAAGLTGRRIRPLDHLGQTTAEFFGTRNPPVWELRPCEPGEVAAIDISEAPQQRLVPALATTLLGVETTVASLEQQVADLTEERDRLRDDRAKLRAQRDSWRQRHERVTGHPVVRAASRLRRRVRGRR